MNLSRANLARLTPLALVLAGVVAGSIFSELLRPTTALAQDKGGQSLPPDTVLNAAEQRKQLIVPLNQLNERLARIEGMLGAGIKVKVTEMPPVTMKEHGK
jgi:hypothetical protein